MLDSKHLMGASVHHPSTCTVRSAVSGACGAAAVWSNGEFAECAKHAADPDALALAQPRKPDGPQVGDAVTVHRHGKTYAGTVSRVTRNGVVYAHVTYGNGATRVVRV